MPIKIEVGKFYFGGNFIEVVVLFQLLQEILQDFLVPVPCPKCGKCSQISSYGGNVVDGNAICPKCHKCINH